MGRMNALLFCFFGTGYRPAGRRHGNAHQPGRTDQPVRIRTCRLSFYHRNLWRRHSAPSTAWSKLDDQKAESACPAGNGSLSGKPCNRRRIATRQHLQKAGPPRPRFSLCFYFDTERIFYRFFPSMISCATLLGVGFVVIKFHREAAATLRHGAKFGRVTEHFRKRHLAHRSP